jgi:hypothetical protein
MAGNVRDKPPNSTGAGRKNEGKLSAAAFKGSSDPVDDVAVLSFPRFSLPAPQCGLREEKICTPVSSLAVLAILAILARVIPVRL